MQLIFSAILSFCSQDVSVTSPFLPLRRKIIYKIPCREFAFRESARSSKWKEETMNVRKKFWVENKI
jgi:hypothetical protein